MGEQLRLVSIFLRARRWEQSEQLKLFILFPVFFLSTPVFREQIRFVHESLRGQLRVAGVNKLGSRREQIWL